MSYFICSESWTTTHGTISVSSFQVFFCLLCLTFFMRPQDIQEMERLWCNFFFFLPLPFRFALVGVGSEASSKKLMDLLPKRELHGQNPVVTPCNKQFLSQFEMQSRKSKPFLRVALKKLFIPKVAWQFFLSACDNFYSLKQLWSVYSPGEWGCIFA